MREKVSFPEIDRCFLAKFKSIQIVPGDPIESGENGATFTPSVSADGVISWTNDKGMDNPEPVNIKGKDGKDGVSPTVSISTITGGYRLTIKDANGTKTVDIMDGEDGTPGKDGSEGVGIASIKQTTTSTADGGNNIFTVTLTNGTSATFTVKNGSKGNPGDKGDPYTLTTTDKNEIAESVKASLTSETWTFELEDGSTVTREVLLK